MAKSINPADITVVRSGVVTTSNTDDNDPWDAGFGDGWGDTPADNDDDSSNW
jgi:hypothetical protein